MSVDDLFGVLHTAIAYFHSISVKYFSEDMFAVEVFVDEGEEFMANVCGDIFGIRWIVPYNIVPWSVSSFFVHRWVIMQSVSVPTFIERLLVLGCRSVKCFLVG